MPRFIDTEHQNRKNTYGDNERTSDQLKSHTAHTSGNDMGDDIAFLSVCKPLNAEAAFASLCVLLIIKYAYFVLNKC